MKAKMDQGQAQVVLTGFAKIWANFCTMIANWFAPSARKIQARAESLWNQDRADALQVPLKELRGLRSQAKKNFSQFQSALPIHIRVYEQSLENAPKVVQGAEEKLKEKEQQLHVKEERLNLLQKKYSSGASV